MKKILHEPLVHFFLAGGLIFLFYSLVGPDGAPDNEIVVDNAVIERLKATWQGRTKREPSPDELDGLLADYLFEELFYREARSLGLGDAFMLPHEFPDVGRSQLGRLFGEDFAAMLFTLKPGSWQGPVPSGYGYHLVYLFDKQDARPILFSESKTRVLQDRQRDRYEQVKQDLHEELKSRYKISYSKEARSLLSVE